MMVPCHLRTRAAAFAGLAVCFATAAGGPEDAIGTLREEWKARAGRDTQTLRDHYAAALLKLEVTFRERGDYAGAARMRTEREVVARTAAIESLQPAPPGMVTGDAPVVLDITSAVLHGGVGLDAGRGVLRGWTTPASLARWTLPPGLKAGGYEVELTWSCPPASGGEVLLREDFYTLRKTIKPSQDWEDYHTEVVGILRLVTNSRVLELTSPAVKGEGLFQLKSIRLLPAAAEGK